jgi:NADH dehydrogenase [ubiquinone] 1 alpha subcomplex assembly factor 7
MLEEFLLQEIQKNGLISQKRFMELALQHPLYGYYRTHEGVGHDFTTAPETSQMFGELLGLWAIDCYEKLGCPPAITLVELGPGRGALMADFLRAAKSSHSFLRALFLHLVEINPVLKQKQQQLIQHEAVSWHEEFEDIPVSPGPLIVIANEFLDALPTQCYVRKDNMLYERTIGIQEGALAFMLNPLRQEEGPDQMWEESPAVEESIHQIAMRLLAQGGIFLCLDYGYEKGDGESLQALFKGKPSSPLAHVGYSDLTCHVNFGRLKALALSKGLGVLGPLGQGKFLKNIGLDLRAETLKHKNPAQRAHIDVAVARLTHPHHMGSLFKVMAVFSPFFFEPIGFES